MTQKIQSVRVQGGTREQHQKAGKAGGLATAKKHGREFYSKIGIKGGAKRKNQALGLGISKYTGKLAMYQELGRKGGKAASRDPQRMAEIGRKGGLARKAKAT